MNEIESRRLLRRHGIVPTAQRVRIAALLLMRHRHVTADGLRAQLALRGQAVAKATVYNTLNLFTHRGLLRQVVVAPGKVFFDSNTFAHHHFYNEDTDTLEDFDSGGVAIRGLPPSPQGTVVERVDVVVRVRGAAGPVAGQGERGVEVEAEEERTRGRGRSTGRATHS